MYPYLKRSSHKWEALSHPDGLRLPSTAHHHPGDLHGWWTYSEVTHIATNKIIVWSNSIVHPRPLNLFMRQCWWFSGWINCLFIELLWSIGPPTNIFIITWHGHVKVVLSGSFPYTYRLRYHNTVLKFLLPNIKARDFDSLISLV